MSLRPSSRKVLAYLSWMVVFSLPPNLAILYLTSRIPHAWDVREKLELFAQDAGRYNLVFVGDSRTYCDFDPDQIDPLLGTRSFNLAVWANWFPTQYPSYQDLIPLLRPGTVVVWSIGHQNFRPIAPTVNFAYPIGLRNVPRYLRWGYPMAEIEDNVASSLLNVFPIHASRDRVMSYLGGFNPLGTWGAPQGPATPLENASRYEELRKQMLADSTVYRVRPWIDGSEITSIEVLKVRGNYTRIELSPDYLRAKQRAMFEALEPMSGPFTPAPQFWNTFVGILDLFQRHHVRLVVNEVEEAPSHYATPEDTKACRAFMKKVRAFVESRGIPYLRVAWEDFSDEDYFDWNHLNSRGIERYSPRVAALLKPHLQ